MYCFEKELQINVSLIDLNKALKVIRTLEK